VPSYTAAPITTMPSTYLPTSSSMLAYAPAPTVATAPASTVAPAPAPAAKKPATKKKAKKSGCCK
jgi:hypothetical protein